MKTTIDTLAHLNKHVTQHCISLQDYKSSKDSKSMAESQAKYHSQQIVSTVFRSQPQR